MDIFGWSRPFEGASVPAQILSAMRQAGVLEDADGGLLRSRLRASTLGGCLFFHSAFPTTKPDAVFFGPDTYRFANAIVELLTRKQAVGRAIDIGAGAGPGGILIAKAFSDAEVLLADVNDQALLLAGVNARVAGAANARPVKSDLFDAVAGQFDLIVANPPYLVDGARRQYRHGGGPLGAELSLAIVREAKKRLAPGGELLLYTGSAIVHGVDLFANAVNDLLASSDLEWTYRETDPDVFPEELDHPPYTTADRIAAVVLNARRIR
jgi:methylase of polypeptide subunit release factors